MLAETPSTTELPGGVGNAISQMSDAVKRVYFGKGSDSLQVGKGRTICSSIERVVVTRSAVKRLSAM